MRNFNIIRNKDDTHIDIYQDELDILKEFVRKNDGKIIWGVWTNIVEDQPDTLEITTLFWVNRSGFRSTSLKDI